MKVIGVLQSVENDMAATLLSFGFNSALSFATELLDRARQAAQSARKLGMVEVSGEHAGWLALQAGMAVCADAVLIPEIPYDLRKVAAKLWEKAQTGRTYGLVVVAEGARPVAGGPPSKHLAAVARRRRRSGSNDKVAIKQAEDMQRDKFDHHILLLQGGGALGAYQAGVYEGLAEAGKAPNWIVGISIGAVNAALIAGNLPERRVERLRAFWDRVSSYAPMSLPAWLSPMRPTLNHLSAMAVVTFGIPGFFAPRFISPFFALDGSPDALSFYDTAPLKSTLEELVDFDRINQQDVRVSLGAVNVRTGASVYFDNQHTRIGPDHVLASGALPPGFPPVAIEGELYWDGGVLSNSPFWYVLDTTPLRSIFILAVDLFSAQGELPRNLDQVLERAKDIQYASKRRFTIDRTRELAELFAALGRVLAKLPSEFKDDPDVQKLAPLGADKNITLVHLLNRHPSVFSQTKDYEFSRATVTEAWAAGLDDVRRTLAKIDSIPPTADFGLGMRLYELPYDLSI